MTIESYNFSDAERIRYGRYPIMDTVLYRWARKIEETLFDHFHTELYAGSSVVEEMKFSAFFSSLKRPRPIYTFTMEPFEGQGLFVLDNRFANICLNKGEEPSQGGPQLGPHNQLRVQKVVQSMMSDFDDSWSDVMNVKTRLKKITTYLFRARILNAFEPCLVAQIHLSGAHASSRLIWCFPRIMLESALDNLRSQPIIPSLSFDRASNQKADQNLFMDQVRYNLSVTLGNIHLKNGGRDIRVGSVLPLSNDVGGDAVIKINNTPLLVGTLGETQGQYAIKVSGSYAERRNRYKKSPGPFKEIKWPDVKVD